VHKSGFDSFSTLQLNLQLLNLLKQVSLIELIFLFFLTHVALVELLTGALLVLPFLFARLDLMNAVVAGRLLNHLADTERPHGDSRL